MRRLLAPLLALSALTLAACGGTTSEAAPATEQARSEAEDALCPAEGDAPRPLPGVTEAHRTLAYWLERAEESGELDAELLSPARIQAHNEAVAFHPDQGLPTDRGSLAAAPALDRLRAEVGNRLTYLREKLRTGEYVDATGAALEAGPAAAFDDRPVRPDPSLRVALAPIPLRCGPRVEGLFKTPVDPSFDRNNCSTIRPQEPVQVLQRWGSATLLVRTRYALGWIASDAPLSPVLPDEARVVWLSGPLRAAPAGAALRSDDGARHTLAANALLPAGEDGVVLFATAAGAHRAGAATTLPDGDPRRLTRRAFLEELFQRLDTPYGWGGQGGGLDCSRLVMDVFGTFGVELPRHSARQAQAGTHHIDLEPIEDLGERQRLIDAAHRRGLVLMHFPGHIMVYLGRDEAGTPMAIHAFAEYLEACGDGGETLRRVERVEVSDLTLGQNTSRRSFLERVTDVVLFAPDLGPELEGLAHPRAAASPALLEDGACEDSLDVRVFHSPARPNPTQPLRVFVTALGDLGPAGLELVDPGGGRHRPALHRLGGPPFTYWGEVESPMAGRWTALLGDGPVVRACDHIRVARHRPTTLPAQAGAIWRPRWRWEADTEALFSAFVEQLFQFPMTGADRDRTWTDLDALLSDPRQNLLLDHFSQGEDERIHLRPDCADLPYFLRTYFAWKMRLPLGYRSCTRGRRGRLPVCTELLTPEVEHEFVDEVEAFHWFIRRQVKHTVHSASGRTHPEDSNTALYPVPMTREAIRPGTVFADPYGHLLVVAAWLPQGTSGEGILVGADAQPDGTVGRRRFWRGSFLFHPETDHVGAGFKGWRPVLYDRRQRAYVSLENREITARRGYTPFSLEQYEGTTNDFYEQMEGLINPRPLDPIAAQRSLVDALDEAVARRVVSVDNGEAWVAQNPGRTMEMPEGGAIFQTGGPWEEYSTPSRDMRLLIAIDTVAGFPEVVRRNPYRFSVPQDEADAAAERVRAFQETELASRRFAYRRSDGQEQPLTLADLVARQRELEMAYNPNDCAELRWGAPDGSAERTSCARHAPGFQRARMASYREWFAERRRPLY